MKKLKCPNLAEVIKDNLNYIFNSFITLNIKKYHSYYIFKIFSEVKQKINNIFQLKSKYFLFILLFYQCIICHWVNSIINTLLFIYLFTLFCPNVLCYMYASNIFTLLKFDVARNPRTLFEYICPKLVFSTFTTANSGYVSTKLCMFHFEL